MNKLIMTLIVAGVTSGASAMECRARGANAHDPIAIANEATPVSAAPDHVPYRRAVLAYIDASASRRDPRADIGGRWVPGPQAMQMVLTGMQTSDALAAARAVGEFPLFVPADAARARRLVEARWSRDRVCAGLAKGAAGSDTSKI